MLRRFWWIVAIALVVVSLVLQTPTSAQSFSSVNSRISQLERENSLLSSRISRLESALSRAGSGSYSAPAEPNYTPPASPILEDPAFERLATLVIELRDRIITLEERAGIPAS